MTLAEQLAARLEAGLRRAPDLLGGDLVEGIPDGRVVPAAVLVPIVVRAAPGLILTLRPDTMRNHAGQISFPGGRIDARDDGPVAAALREAEEEIALPPGVVTVLGCLPQYRTVTGFAVTPVVGLVPPDLPLVPAPDEVADLFEAPLAPLLDPDAHRQRSAMFRGRMRDYYEIRHGERLIWGATAAMIVNLSRLLEPVHDPA